MKNTSMLAMMAGLFGMGGRTKQWVSTPQGNRALPKSEQDEIKLLAHNKRMRKRELCRAVHFQQIKLGHFEV